MPAFNTNIFKLATPDYLCSHVYEAVEATEDLTQNEASRQDSLMKAYQKLKQKSNTSNKNMISAANEDATQNKLNYFLFS